MRISRSVLLSSTLALLGIGFAALLFIVLGTIWLGERAQMHMRDVAAAQELRSAATLLSESLLTSESSQRGYVLTGNEIYLAPYDNAKSVARAELKRLRTLLVGRPDREPLVQQLSSVVEDKLTEQDTTIALKNSMNSAQAVEKIKTNRGKALMDEANVYLSALVLEANDRLSSGVSEQASNAEWLRWTSAASALVIILVVAGVLETLRSYTSEILKARDEVRRTNENLEQRVQLRTEQLAQARDRAELLLTEVNHRVANSLALVSSLVRLQSRELREPSAKAALEETDTRIQAIAAMHKHLFTTGNVGEVAVDTYLSALLSQLQTTMQADGSSVMLVSKLDSITIPTNDAINLGIIITEWVTNAYKYAYSDSRGEVRVHLHKAADGIEVDVEDDGVGRGDDPEVRGTGLGTRVVKTIAGLMKGKVIYEQLHPGTRARLVLPLNSVEPVEGVEEIA